MLSCAVLRASFVDWARILLHTGPSAVHTVPYHQTTDYCCCALATVRHAYCACLYGAGAVCVLLVAQAKALQTSITQDYIRPSAANLPPDRSPHTALERVFCNVLGCTCRQLLPPHPSSFSSSFFFSSVPFWLRRLLTPLWLNSLRASTSLFSSPRHKPPPQPPVFFSSPLPWSPLSGPSFAVSVFPLFGPTNLEQPATPSPTTPPSTRAPKSLSRVLSKGTGRLRDLLLLLLLLLAPPSKQRQHYLRAQDSEKHTHRLHCCCTACLSVRGRSIEAPARLAQRSGIGARVFEQTLVRIINTMSIK